MPNSIAKRFLDKLSLEKSNVHVFTTPSGMAISLPIDEKTSRIDKKAMVNINGAAISVGNLMQAAEIVRTLAVNAKAVCAYHGMFDGNYGCKSCVDTAMDETQRAVSSGAAVLEEEV